MRAILPAISPALLIPIFFTAATACRPGGITSITPADLRSHAGYLASDELAGRMTGTEGIGRAEQYIADAFSRFGLQPLPGDDDHFIDFSLYHKGYDSTGTFTDITVQGQTYHGEAGVGVKPFFFSGEGQHEAELIFVGYGITASEYAYDDYEGLDVKGKLVLMLRHEPNNDDPDSSFKGTSFTRHAYFVTKAKNAQAHGAAGMILFTDPLWQGGVDDLRLGGRYYLDPGGESVEAGPFELKPAEPLKLRVFVDKSVVEIFANDRQAVMRRIYPERKDSLGVVLFSQGGATKVKTLNAWDMMPSNPY